MRRKDRELTDKNTIENIINKAMVCRIAFSLDNVPYIVPMNFCYENNFIYLHSLKVGKKIDILKKNENVCFEIDIDTEIKQSNNPCNWTMKYYSVIGQGIASFMEEKKDKINILNKIMEKYSGKNLWIFQENMLDSVIIIKINIIKFTGKKSI
ncbi:MAG: pyridoxamine 5'-phosphate oxidase family protein [Candidatus Lokiarchaeota archaeon]|nr:pyridoxamine 5'-phosphate oxidase family protein [Candidatus Lokiarchaeota archaeon]